MPKTATRPATGGTSGATEDAAPAPGSLFGVPKYSTQPRVVPDNGNSSLGATLNGGAQVNLPTTKLDQLDIVTGMKLEIALSETWTQGSGKTLSVSPFYPANIIQQITFKLQAAYNTFNLPGVLASAFQAIRPLYGNRKTSLGDTFAQMGGTPNIAGTANTPYLIIDVPFALKFDEYFDLTPQGDPMRKLYDAIVSPMYMAAQARVVVPTITFNPQMAVSDLLGGPVSRASADALSTFAGTASAKLSRVAYWTASNPAANPPQFPWLYTRDFFTQPTSGQNQVGVLIQNTGVSVGQVLALIGFVWDPQANSGAGAAVALTNIDHFEIVTGGSLQNIQVSPQLVQDKMRSQYGNDVAAKLETAGIFVFDWALADDGSYLSNANAINTYLVNGVQLNIYFKSGSVPSATSTVYLGVEALKLATS